MALERGGESAAALAHLIGRLADTGVASRQQLRAGLARAADALPDISLDVPDVAERWDEFRALLGAEHVFAA